MSRPSHLWISPVDLTYHTHLWIWASYTDEPFDAGVLRLCKPELEGARERVAWDPDACRVQERSSKGLTHTHT